MQKPRKPHSLAMRRPQPPGPQVVRVVRATAGSAAAGRFGSTSNGGSSGPVVVVGSNGVAGAEPARALRLSADHLRSPSSSLIGARD